MARSSAVIKYTNFNRICIVFCALIISACASSKISSKNKRSSLKESYCVPSIKYDYSGLPAPILNIDSLLKANPVLIKKLSYHDILMCNAIGITPLLIDFFKLEEASSVNNRLELLWLKQKITDRLLLASIEIQAVLAELDCEAERVAQVASFVDKKNSKRNTRLIVSSVIVGAIATIGSASSNNNLSKWVGITGGLISASLGALTINPGGKKIEFKHERNLLEGIWFDSSAVNYYPPCAWYVLNEKGFSNSRNVTLVQSIRKRWLHFEFNGKIGTRTENLLFKKGGFYTSENLHIRAALINQLQSTIRSINQDLAGLTLSLNKIL
jgi:hypothetical protein